MRTLGRIALVGVMAAATLGLTMGNATALYSGCAPAGNDEGGVNCWIYHESNNIEVDEVRFEAYDEKLYMNDMASNGAGVGAWVEGTWYKFPYEAGYTGYWWDLSFPEGEQITLTSCQTNGDRHYDCWTRYATA
jgi:hypothetical protein